MSSKILLAAVLGLAVLGVACQAVVEKNTEADALAQKVLAMIAANEADKLYDEMGATELREQVTRQEWQAVIKNCSVKLGAPKSCNRTSFNIETKNGLTTGEYVYQMQWEKGSGTFTLKVKSENNVWKVLGVSCKSSALEAEETSRPATSRP